MYKQLNNFITFYFIYFPQSHKSHKAVKKSYIKNLSVFTQTISALFLC